MTITARDVITVHGGATPHQLKDINKVNERTAVLARRDLENWGERERPKQYKS